MKCTTDTKPSKNLRFLNPVLISLLLVFLVTLILSDSLDWPLMRAFLWIALPTSYECQNFGGSTGVMLGWFSYLLAFLVLIFYFVVLNSETIQQYTIGSVLGVISTGAWFFWGVLIFLICGVSAH